MTRRGVLIVGLVGGIGFTMSLFIAQLAFPPGPLLDTAKLAILVGSAVAILVGLGLGLVVNRRPWRERRLIEVATAARLSTRADPQQPRVVSTRANDLGISPGPVGTIEHGGAAPGAGDGGGETRALDDQPSERMVVILDPLELRRLGTLDRE
jgi:hypothetical protein